MTRVPFNLPPVGGREIEYLREVIVTARLFR